MHKEITSKTKRRETERERERERERDACARAYMQDPVRYKGVQHMAVPYKAGDVLYICGFDYNFTNYISLNKT